MTRIEQWFTEVPYKILTYSMAKSKIFYRYGEGDEDGR